MSSVETHNRAVCAKNIAAGQLRETWRMPRTARAILLALTLVDYWAAFSCHPVHVAAGVAGGTFWFLLQVIFMRLFVATL